jgi:hypothetical protein
MPTALRSFVLLDVVSTTPAVPKVRAPCIHARLHPLATEPDENWGFIPIRHVLIFFIFFNARFLAARAFFFRLTLGFS